jgi:RNA polymerase sigma-70 factor, ECF subfamily
MATYLNWTALLIARRSSGGDGDAVQRGVLGMFSQEADRSNRPTSNIVDLYDELRASLFRYLVCLGLTSPQADDVIQEAFLGLFQHLEAGGER